jgi:CRISPR system Cascade subunit CasE
MYLTELENPKGDDYEAHKHLAKVYDGQQILFLRKGAHVTILSPAPGATPDAQVRHVEGIVSGIKEGDAYLFRTRLNPTVAVKEEWEPDGQRRRRGKRRAVGEKDMKKWLDNLFAKCGAHAEYSYSYEGIRRAVKRGTSVSLASCNVSGVITVQDPEMFRKAVTQGVGHAKRFGFGMLHIFDTI